MPATKRMYKGQPGTSDAVAYTAPSGGAVAKSIRAINFDTTARKLYLGTEGTANTDLILPPYPLEANLGFLTDSDLCSLESGQTLHIKAEVASMITVHIFGMEL